MAGGGDAQRGRLGVEHHHADRDELLDALERRHLPVELLERLRRIAELPEEDPQQVLGLERGDRRLDAVTGDVADHRRDARGRHAEHVVEVAGHEAGAGLVHAAELEAGEVGQVLGGEPGRPAPRRQLLLGQHLLGAPLEEAAVLGQAGLPSEVLAGRAPRAPTGTRMKANRRTARSVSSTATTAAATASTAYSVTVWTSLR